MAYNFDFDSRIIHVVNPQTDVTISDLHAAIRNAEASTTGIQYAKICNASGKESLGPGVAVGITLELLGWQIKFWDGDYMAKVAGGNLVGGLDGDPVAYSAGVQTLLIQSAASTVVQISGGSGLSAAESDKLMSLPSADTTAATVWAKDGAGEKLSFTAAVNGGKWTIAGNQMVFFDTDNMTEVARFDLFDADGNPTMDAVFTRSRV